MLSIWYARNLEFLRDPGTVFFTLLVPILLVVAMSLLFGGAQNAVFKVGVLTRGPIDVRSHAFLREQYVDFLPIGGERDGLEKVTHQRIDLLVDLHGAPRYWVNSDSPKGYIVEKLLLASDPGARREQVTGAAVRYVDWLFPGVLGMNMMFSCLYGVGYAVLRYRKSDFLKRLHATPLTAFEFLTAQVLSRLSIILVVTGILYLIVSAIIHFHSAGSAALMVLLAILGSLSMVALGLTVAARFSTEETVASLLNLLSWPMTLLSGIWFSLEGSPEWVRWLADVFPLTHLLDASRAVMFDGAGLTQIAPDLMYLAMTAVLFLGFGAWSFRWRIT
jgi:ABC-type multidrug transport system permease subunit